MINLENFKNLYEVRKSARFKIVPKKIFKQKEDRGSIYNTEDIVKQYKGIVKDLESILYYENFVPETQPLSNKLWDLFDFSKFESELEENEEISSLKNKESSDLIRIKHAWLQKYFTNDWHENKDSIISKRWDPKRNIEVKMKNWTTIWSVKFLKEFFESFFTDANKYFDVISKLLQVQDFERNRQSDIKLALQTIQWKDHLYKIYQLFEWGYIEHKNDNTSINELQEKLKVFKNNVNNYIENCRINDSFGLPLEYVSLNYYTRRKSQKDYDEEILKKSESLKKKFDWDLWELYWISKELEISDLYNNMKLFKANQKSAFLQLLQSQTPFSKLKNNFEYIDNKWERYSDYKIQLFDDITEENYNEMKDLTFQIEKSDDKKTRKELKEKRWKYFLFHCKKYNKFCDWYFYPKNGEDRKFFNWYKQVAMAFWKRKAEVLSLEREKILAERERWYGFLSKDAGNNYYINTFDIENTKNAYDFFSNQSQKQWEITYYILSSITLRALEKLCFSKSSNFYKWNIVQKIDGKFLKIQEVTGNKIFKSKRELEEEENLIEFLAEVLRLQNTLWIKFKSEKSLDNLKHCENMSDFEILLKKETYVLDEYKISKEDFEKALEKFKWNSFLIIDKDSDNHNKNSVFSQWWTRFWQKNNAENYILRINPELIISFRKWDTERFKGKISFHRRKNDAYMVSFSFSHFSDKSYITSEFIDDAERKENLKKFNDLYNENVTLEYIYWIDKWTNELVTLWIFKRWKKWLEKVDISEKIPVYRITKKGLKYFEDTETRDSNEKKKRYLSKNVSYFLKDLENNELFEKLDIDSCLWDLTYAKIIKWNIILNADIFTTVNLYKVTAKRFLNDATFRGKIKNNTVLFDDENKSFYFEYENRWKLQKQNIFYWKDDFDYLPCDDIFQNLKEEVQNELNMYLTSISNEEDISMQRVNNYKNAISANIVWIITELQKHFNGYICYETLDAGQIEKKWFNTFIWNTLNEKIYNKLQLSLEVPPILKKFRTDIWAKETIQHWKIIYVNEKNTSSACPICNEQLLNWNLSDKKDNEVFKLWWHLSDFENNMKHLTDLDYQEWLKNKSFKKANTNKKWEIEKNKYNSWTINWKSCDYHIGNENYPEFEFIKSWDDLATYNIAKKAKEYLESLPKKEDSE